MHGIISDYKEIKRTKIPGFSHPLHKVKDFSTYREIIYDFRTDLNPFLKRKTTISEKAFILDLVGYAHFHFIFDKLAQYEFIKKLDPEINLYVLTDSYHAKEKSNILKDIKSVYSIPESNIFDIDSGEKYLFKNIFFIWSTHNDFFKHTFINDIYFGPWDAKKDFKTYIETIYPLLRARFQVYIKPRVDNDLKIFISRFNQHEHFGRDKDKVRYISKNDELELEKFFKYKGYIICTVDDMDLSEQIGLYSGASRIASLKSSGLVNTIFCGRDSEIISINLDDEYQVYYDYICKFTGLTYTELPSIHEDPEGFSHSKGLKEIGNRKTFSFKEIEKSLLENLNKL
jgi:hypothetical protein